MKRNAFLWVLIISLSFSCKREEPQELLPVLDSSCDLVCKSNAPLKGEEPDRNQSCVFWEYDGEGILTMTHFNAGFNCCPEAILTSMKINGDTLEITERDSMQLCRCNCLYDVDFVIRDLKPGKYVVRIHEPFVIEPLLPLTFTLDLEAQVAGKACDYREYYPWGI